MANCLTKLVGYEKQADNRDFNAVKRITVATMKLLFPHWTTIEDVNREEFRNLLPKSSHFIVEVLLKNNVIISTLNLKFKCLNFGSRIYKLYT